METCQLDCSCVLVRYSDRGDWFVHRLCEKHKKTYYTNTNSVLNELREMAKEKMSGLVY